MKKTILISVFLFGAALSFAACNSKNDGGTPKNKPAQQNEAAATMQQLWATSPMNVDFARQGAFVKMQGYADNCPATYFKNYMKSLDAACESIEKTTPILTCYRMAFDSVLYGVQNEQVAAGTVVIWMLYNMGYVIKTPTACFGIDIYHRWAKKLAPYLDFLCVTHNHQDHYSEDLMQAMFDAGKPVLSNYYRKNTGYEYTATVAKNYTIGDVAIRTAIADHNNTDEGKNFVTVFRIDCGESSGHFTLLHVGDSNYNPAQFGNVQGAVNVLIPRYAPNALTENNILGTAVGQVQPDYILLSHILELSHVDVAGSRWTIDLALERASKINCEKTCVPMWGEKLVWKNGELK